MVYAQLRICLGGLDAQTPLGLWDVTDHVISARRPDLIIINNKKASLQNGELCCPGWPQSKIERKQKEG